MSATNWAVCFPCLIQLKELFEKFKKQYYGEIDNDLYLEVVDEFRRKIGYISIGNTASFEVNDELLKKMDNVIDYKYAQELEITPDSGTTLREDYAIGIGDKGYFYCTYRCSCDSCGFNYKFDKADIK